MPGGALPVAGESGRTLEYPAPLLSMQPLLGRVEPGLKSKGAGAASGGITVSVSLYDRLRMHSFLLLPVFLP